MASQLFYTPVEDIPKIYAELRQEFNTGRTKSIAFRKEQLVQLGYLIKDNQARFREALKIDLGRPEFESDMLDIGAALSEIKDAWKNVGKWAKQENAPFDFNWFAMKPAVRKEPKGVVLIISPFNFPMLLAFGHMAGAIAAGNAVLLKPSELTPATDQLMAELFPKYLDPGLYKVVNGDVPVITKLLELRWDHILFTGGGRVARIVLTAAAKHLTPVTTELGGKSPVIVDSKCDMKLAARRILWGKFANAGQICVVPDYVLIARDAQDAFINVCQEIYKEFFSDSDPKASEHFGRIVSEAHTARLRRYLDETKGTVVFGGETDLENKYVAPTLVRDVPPDDSLMQDELFGPILPIVAVGNVDEAIEFVNAREHPLTLYVFSQDAAFKKKVFDNTQSGAAIANEVNIHVGAYGLPLGGIGPSGSGYLSGKFAFDTFTHFRGTMDNPGWVDSLILSGRYPPYTPKNVAFLRKLFNVSLPPRPGQNTSSGWSFWLVLALLGVASALLTRRQVS